MFFSPVQYGPESNHALKLNKNINIAFTDKFEVIYNVSQIIPLS